MELQEHGHEYRDDSIEHECHLDNNVLGQLLLIFLLCAIVIRVKTPLNTFQPSVPHRDDHEVGDNQHVDQEQDEKFAIPKSNAVIDPGAVMVHVEYAPIAAGAMMTTFRLKYVAHEAVSAALILRVAQVEAPEDGYLAGIRSH